MKTVYWVFLWNGDDKAEGGMNDFFAAAASVNAAHRMFLKSVGNVQGHVVKVHVAGQLTIVAEFKGSTWTECYINLSPKYENEKYWMFSWHNRLPQGGMKDFTAAFATPSEAKGKLSGDTAREEAHIVYLHDYGQLLMVAEHVIGRWVTCENLLT